MTSSPVVSTRILLRLAGASIVLLVALLVLCLALVLPFAGSMSALVSAENWPLRGTCGHWTPWHEILAIVFDETIGIAYFVIPALLVWRWSRWERFAEYPAWMFLGVILFCTFIVSCGLTHHVGDVMPFYYPAYWLVTAVSFACATASIAAIVWLLFAPARKAS